MRRLPAAGIETFLAVAEHGSLRAAAGALGVQPPAVSQQLKAFEEQIGVSVFARTTRAVRLTEAGRALLARARPAMTDLAAAVEDARGVGRTRKGTLRLSLPYRAYQLVIAPRLAAFQRDYPDIELELSFDEGLVDIAAARFHAGIRLGDRIDQEMIAVRLTPPLKGAYVGAPAYFRAHGRPKRPRDLLDHACLRYRFIQSGRIAPWQFQGPDGLQEVGVSGRLVFNCFRTMIEAAVAGHGIAWSLRAGVAAELGDGRLGSVLDRVTPDRPGFYLYYPRANARMEILRLFIDAMRPRQR